MITPRPLILVLILIGFAGTAQAQSLQPNVTLDQLDRGGFAFKGEEGLLELAPMMASEADYQINGLLARARITQHYINPHAEWQEGIYVFPLPETAAVDTLIMRVGDRIIEGRIEKREEARVLYQEAADAGQRASLVEQERPNIFTASVANIAPGAEIVIEIEYQHKIDIGEEAYSLRLPMVVGPRFIPVRPVVALVGGNPTLAMTHTIADAERITFPVRHPDDGPINPVHLTVTLSPGFPVASIESTSHDIDITFNADGSHTITTVQDAVPANKDFELTWYAAPDTAPRVALYEETIDDRTYLLGLVTPPAVEEDQDAPRIPRELIFVIDTSGSMSGSSIRQAREALILALERLHRDDRFNIIRFASQASSLFDGTVRADGDTVEIAIDYAASLSSSGGTNMMNALDMALAGEPQPGYLRQIVFMTDGSVGNEAELFTRVSEGLGDARLFTVGIGSAPNGYFMRKAAEFGRGSFTFIDNIHEVEDRMSELLGSLERPVVTDLELGWPDDSEFVIYPAPLPDLYAGDPLVFTARIFGTANEISVAGQVLGDTWNTTLSLDQARPAEGIARLWARDRIDDLENMVFEGADRNVVETEVTQIALQFGLLTQHTSMVAIDVTPVRPLDQKLATHDMPANLPEGWDYEAVFGEDGTALPTPVTTLQRVSLDMPSSATPSELLMILGALLLLSGSILFVVCSPIRRHA